MDRYMYLNILQETMVPYAESSLSLTWKFMHHNDPKHTAKLIKEFLTEEQVEVIKWPAQSPDLNPIENLWDQLEVDVRRKNRDKFKNNDVLFAALLQAWNEISGDVIKNLIESMPKRCQAVIKSKGYATKY